MTADRDADPPAQLRLTVPSSLVAVAAALAGECRAAGLTVAVDARPNRGVLHALSAGVADVALADRAAWEVERRPYRQLAGGEPRWIRVATRDPARLGRRPPAAYVHRSNAIDRLTRQQLAGILTRGAEPTDITHWGQLGAGPPGRRIHVYGEADDGGFFTNVRLVSFDGRQVSLAYESLPSLQVTIDAVANDPHGIALLDEIDVGRTDQLRAVAIAGDDRQDRPYADPLASAVVLYLPREGDLARSPAGRFVRVILSDAGQQAMASASAGLVAMSPAASADARRLPGGAAHAQ